MEEATISVIIPVYNVAPYLEKCVESVRRQSYPKLQILLIDDGSTDGSGDICEECGRRDERIEVIHQKNQGLSVARNTGMDHSRGEWIAFLDSDDWLEPDAYKVLLETALQNDADISSCLSRSCVMGEEPPAVQDSGEVFLYEDPLSIVRELRTKKRLRFEVWNKLWRRSLVDPIRFVPGQVSEDVHFGRIAFLKANRIAHIDKTLHNYLVGRPGSTLATFKMARFGVFEEYSAFMRDLEGLQNREAAAVVAAMAVRYLLNMYIEAVDTGQSREVKNRIKKLFNSYYKDVQNTAYADSAAKTFASSPTAYYFISKAKSHLSK